MTRQLLATAAIAALAACATQPEPCTPEWVEWKSEKVLNSFAREHYSFIRDLRGLEGQLDNPGPVTAMRIVGMADDLIDVVGDFRGEVMPELNAAVKECGSVEKLMPTFITFLRKEGVDDDVLQWVESFGALAETVQDAL